MGTNLYREYLEKKAFCPVCHDFDMDFGNTGVCGRRDTKTKELVSFIL